MLCFTGTKFSDGGGAWAVWILKATINHRITKYDFQRSLRVSAKNYYEKKKKKKTDVLFDPNYTWLFVIYTQCSVRTTAKLYEHLNEKKKKNRHRSDGQCMAVPLYKTRYSLTFVDNYYNKKKSSFFLFPTIYLHDRKNNYWLTFEWYRINFPIQIKHIW